MKTTPNFYFELKLKSDVMSFQEVSGLAAEIHDEGGRRYTNIVLKRGIGKRNGELWSWLHSLSSGVSGRVKTETVTISLLDEQAAHLMNWEVKDAWLVKAEIAEASFSNGQVLVETLEFAYENFSRIAV